jgi:uncharacterized protein YjdB
MEKIYTVHRLPVSQSMTTLFLIYNRHGGHVTGRTLSDVLGHVPHRFGLIDMETDGTNLSSLFRDGAYLYLQGPVHEMSGTRINFPASAADLFVNTAGHRYYAAVSGNTLHLFQHGVFKGPLTLPAPLGHHHMVATLVIGTDQYLLYTDNTGRLQVISYKIGPDPNAPVNSTGFPRVTGVDTSGFTVEAMTDESASIFYIVVDDGSPAPTSAQVMAGAGYGAVTVRASGNFNVLPNSMNSRAVTGLTAGTQYDVYVVAKDREGNIQPSPALIETATAAPVVPVTGVTIAPTTATINVGATQQLTVTVAPVNATNQAVTWTSSDTAVATVSPTGLVTAVAAGNATITVTTVDGDYTATSAITVVVPVVPVTGVTIAPTTATINVGATQQLTVTVAPVNATNQAVTWTSSDTAVATVSPTGLVTAVAAGNATITVTTIDGGFTDTSTITVVVPVVDRLPGDVTGDGKVDAQDLSAVALALNSTPESPNWNPAADLNQDGIVDVFDLVLVGRNFGKGEGE